MIVVNFSGIYAFFFLFDFLHFPVKPHRKNKVKHNLHDIFRILLSIEIKLKLNYNLQATMSLNKNIKMCIL